MAYSEKAKQAHLKWRLANPDTWADAQRRSYKKHRAKRIRALKERDQKVRMQVIRGYGGCCVCCGESNWRFLALDHRDDDGAEHRRRGVKGGTTLHTRLIKANFPRYIQLLCHNCNVAKGLYGFCPHGNCWHSLTSFA